MLSGYIGNRQLLCSVCSMQAALCCTKCSSADKIFVCCSPSLRPCLAAHKANPTDEAHKYRRPSGRHGTKPSKGRKRPGKEAAAAAAAESAAKRPRGVGGSRSGASAGGSRSGASASFDSHSFRPRRRRGADSDEDEDEDEEEEGGGEEGEEEDGSESD